MSQSENQSLKYYPVFRVNNVFTQLKSLRQPNNSISSQEFRRIFNCKSQKQFLFCQMLFDKELELMKECYPNKENGDKFYQALYSDFLEISNNGFSELLAYGSVASNIATFLDSVNFNEAEQRIEIGKLQEELNKIIEKQKELLSDGKNPDGINKKLVLYAIDCLENVNLILKNFDKISIEFTIEELIKFQDKNQDMKDFTAKVTKFIEKYAPKVTYDFCIAMASAMASGVLLGLGQ